MGKNDFELDFNFALFKLTNLIINTYKQTYLKNRKPKYNDQLRRIY